jgi:ferredoxin-NADP reductase
VLITRPIREVLPATRRARTVRIDLGRTPFPYLPGQAVLVASHGGERRRPYSIAIAPEESEREDCLELLVGVDAEGNAGSHLSSLDRGVLLDIEGPVGRFTFPMNPAERRFLFIAGGTGISPLRAMLHHALHTPHEKIGLLFSARTGADFAYEGEFRDLAKRRAIELQLRVTRDAEREDWPGSRGRIGRDDLAPLVHGQATLCFVCGPAALVEEIPALLEALGVPAHRIKTEERVDEKLKREKGDL